MRKKKWRQSVIYMLYDHQKVGKRFLSLRQSFGEVAKTLQGERKK